MRQRRDWALRGLIANTSVCVEGQLKQFQEDVSS
jgi:hypothetical protein